MKQYNSLLTSLEENILTITINRPDSLNALNKETLEELKDVIQHVYDEEEIRGAIITGEGDKSFAAGADVQEIATLNEVNGRKFSEDGQEILDMIEKCTKPIMAAINGFALGGGCELAMACHIRVAVEQAKLGLPEVSLGIVPGYGGTQRLTQLVGKGYALELMMTGRMITANEAESLGLVNYVVKDKDAVIGKCNEIFNEIFKNAPLAVGMVIDCVNAAYNSEENGYQTEANSFANCCKSKDFEEGTTAFIEKRKPEFRGE